MKRLLALLLLIPNLAFAQITQQEVLNTIASNLPTNNANEISALLLRNTLDVMTSAIYQGVPIQTGTVCPPLTGLIPFQFFANTTSTTDTTISIYDGTNCIKFADLNQTTHTMGLTGTSLITHPLTDGYTNLGSNTTLTAQQIYCPFSVNGCNVTTGGTEWDVIRGVLDLESVTGGTVSQANAIGGYAYCNVVVGPYPAAGNCVALSGFAVIAKNGGQAWGIATDCQDNSSAATYVGSALNRRVCNGAEFDVGIWDTSGTALASGILISLQGGGTHSAGLTGINIANNAFGGLAWNFGLDCNDGATNIGCVNIGTVASSGASASQSLVFEYNFTGSSQKAMTMFTPSDGGFKFTTTDFAINNGFDWSAVTFNQCVLKIAFGCSLDGNGNIIAHNLTITGTGGSITINGTTCTLTSTCTVTAAAGTLTGTTLNSTVVTSSLTSVGTLVSLAVTGNSTSGNATYTTAAPTVAAAQIGYGSTTVAAGSGNCPTGTVGTKTVAGCIVMNVAGSTAVVPYF